jgi:hypothetical protein
MGLKQMLGDDAALGLNNPKNYFSQPNILRQTLGSDSCCRLMCNLLEKF